VTAGPATVLLGRGELRYYSIGGLELLRRVYVAVRDTAWETLPADFSEMELHERDDGGVRATYEAHVADGDIVFGWAGVIELSRSGELNYSMTGVSGSSFDYARIGLNILHPPSLEGRRYRAVTDHGVLEGEFPPGIAEQPLVGGEYLPLLPGFRSLGVHLDGADLHFTLTGDEFELEDQRNWLDASYKTYSTPMSLGIRHSEAGESIAQEVRVRAEIPAAGGGTTSREDQRVVIEVGRGSPGGVFPSIGLGLAWEAEALSATGRGLFEGLGLDHLRVDVRLSANNFADVVARADSIALCCGCGLELAAFVDAKSAAELDRLAAEVRALAAPLRRILAFSEHELVTSPGVVAAIRGAVGTAAPVFGGTNLYFAELNRERPDPTSADGFAFSANPQVHSADDRSLTEAPQTFFDMLQSARRFLGNVPIAVGPITLLPRFNPDAPGASTIGLTEPPADERQASLVCATFTALAAKHLAAGKAASVTMFETTGPRGLFARSESQSGPTEIGSVAMPPGAAFPVADVVSVWGRWQGLPAVSVGSSDALLVDAAACRIGARLEVLVANATGDTRAVELKTESGAPSRGTIRRLDPASVAANWAAGGTSTNFSDREEIDGVHFDLGPYALALVEIDGK